MSAKYRNKVSLTWNGPNGRFMKMATTDREVGRLCRKYGMPSDVDAIQVKVGGTRTEADNLPLSGRIPASQAQGLISVKSFTSDSAGTIAQPMTFQVMDPHNGENATLPDAKYVYVEPGLLRREWADYRAPGGTDMLGGSDRLPTLRDKVAASGTMTSKRHKLVERAVKVALGAQAYIMTEEGTKEEVPPVGPLTWSYRLGTPDTYKDGTPRPNPDMYLIYGEKGQNSDRLTREDMNRVTPAEARQVERLCMNFTRSRDAQRITKKSDIMAKSDGADMWDAMQDSVLYYAQALKWSQTLTIAAYDIESREPSHWSIIPRKYVKMAEEADILGEEVDLGAYTVNLSKKSLMWQAVRNAARDNFTIPDAAERAFRAKFLKTDIDPETGEFGTTLEEYVQITNNGTPGYTLTYPDRFQANWDGTRQASAEPARSGWTLRLRNGKGGSTRKPQHVAIGSLRTSQDNPYQDVRFRAAWGNGDEYPILRELFEIGINAADLGKAPIWTDLAQKVLGGTRGDTRHIKAVKEQARTEWTKLRESLEVFEDVTSTTEDTEAVETAETVL